MNFKLKNRSPNWSLIITSIGLLFLSIYLYSDLKELIEITDSAIEITDSAIETTKASRESADSAREVTESAIEAMKLFQISNQEFRNEMLEIANAATIALKEIKESRVERDRVRNKLQDEISDLDNRVTELEVLMQKMAAKTEN